MQKRKKAEDRKEEHHQIQHFREQNITSIHGVFQSVEMRVHRAQRDDDQKRKQDQRIRRKQLERFKNIGRHQRSNQLRQILPCIAGDCQVSGSPAEIG